MNLRLNSKKALSQSFSTPVGVFQGYEAPQFAITSMVDHGASKNRFHSRDSAARPLREGRGAVPTRRPWSHEGFTLMELLVTTAIIAALATLAFGGFNAVMQQSRKAAEISAAKNLIAAYLLYPSDYNGQLMVAHYEGASPELDGSEYELPDGTRLSSTELHRYPFRLAPYMNDTIKGTILVNRNEAQIKKAFPGSQFYYGASLCPALGINYYFVGGYKVDNEVAGAGDCATHIMHVADPASLLVFASAFTEIGEDRVDGRYGVEPPNYRTSLWGSSLHVDARYSGRAVTAFMDGSVRMLSLEELKDMRLWSIKAAAADNADYRVAAEGNSGIGGGGGGRSGRR